jgi:biotin carboxyl carrier protein
MITSHERPRLREDLVAEAIEDQGARFIDVIDPDTGSAYRFYDVEYSLACAMDGQRDIPGLVRWAQEELGVSPSPTELKTVIATLGDLGYLDAAAATAATAASDELELAPNMASPPAPAPASGVDLELGQFRAPLAAAVADAAPDIELGVPGTNGGVRDDQPDLDLPLGPAGVAVPALPVPGTPATRTPAAPPARSGSVTRVGTDMPKAAEPKRPAQPVRSSSPQLRPEAGQRPSEPALASQEPKVAPFRTSEPKVAESPFRTSEARTRPSEPTLRPSEPIVRPAAPAAPAASSDPSLNLSLPIRPDDVKEAVRASREMRSVDVPADLMQALENAELGMRQPAPAAPAPVVAPPPPLGPAPLSSPARAAAIAPPLPAPRPPTGEPMRTSPAMPSSAVLDPIGSISGSHLSMSEPISPPSVPPLVPVPRLEPPPPSQVPRAPEARPALTPAPRDNSAPIVLAQTPPRRSSTWVVVLLVLAILGVVGFGVWKFVISKAPATPEAQPPAVSVKPPPVEPPAPPPPAPVTAKLSLIKPPASPVKAPVAGVLQSVIADGTAVREGDPLALFTGGKPFEQKIVEIKGDLDKRYPADVKRLEAAIAAAAGNPSSLARLQTELTNRKNRIAARTKELEAAEAELAKLAVVAKAAGKVTAIAKAGARVAVGADLVMIEPESYLSGAADTKKPVTAKAGDPLQVKTTSGAASCVLETVQGTMVSFRCPATDGLAEGTEVVLESK